MKNVLIVSYDYAPLPHAASYMVQSRACHLKAAGWQPVILTRHWADGNRDVTVETNDPPRKDRDPVVDCVVYRTAYRQSHKRWLAWRSCFSSDQVMFKLINFILRTCLQHPDEHRGWHRFAVEAGIRAVKEEDIQVILGVGSPWTDFWVARDISRATNVPWVASYMDPWTQVPPRNIWPRRFSWKWCLRQWISRRMEKNTSGRAACAVHNSTPWAEELQKFLNIPVHVIPHGVDSDDVKAQVAALDSKCLTLSYVGSLHFTQKTDVFFQGLADFVERYQVPPDQFRVEFVGSGPLDRRLQGSEKIQPFIHVVPPVSREEARARMTASHILLLFLIDDNGWYPMKIYEYLSAPAVILASPRDRGVVDELLRASGKGVSLNTPAEISRWLKVTWDEFLNQGKLDTRVNREALDAFDRRANVKKLAALLDQVSEKHGHIR